MLSLRVPDHAAKGRGADLKYILGIGDLLTGYLLTFDALKMNFRKVKIHRNPKCAVCGDAPTITELIDYEQPACDLRKH